MAGEYVWLVTGSNRGIGLELVKQLLSSPSNIVIAACRNPSKAAELHALSDSAKGRLRLVALDVASKESIREAAQEVAGIVGDKGVDYLINNAGINPGGEDTAFTLDVDVLEQVFATNVVGPAYVAQAFSGLVEKSTKKTIVNVSSTLGSMGADYGTRCTSYSVTKAALNMLTYKEAKEKPDITAISMCPGWLQTDMGGQNAALPVSVGVAGILKTVLSLKPEDSGQFFNFKGERVPW
ncbi:NAD(P)-binding protein [Polyporus arcularius HHB13444]|uniref:NAD(P)-binding protein n=1 Tax=Polyporus arcularius HHB13444 TaxID=1314778 RepID=A0A5C3PGJ6_9APHY|nr:NAD(P)-binding protein [Polyporus arcularius HHB13444]